MIKGQVAGATYAKASVELLGRQGKHYSNKLDSVQEPSLGTSGLQRKQSADPDRSDHLQGFCQPLVRICRMVRLLQICMLNTLTTPPSALTPATGNTSSTTLRINLSEKGKTSVTKLSQRAIYPDASGPLASFPTALVAETGWVNARCRITFASFYILHLRRTAYWLRQEALGTKFELLLISSLIKDRRRLRLPKGLALVAARVLPAKESRAHEYISPAYVLRSKSALHKYSQSSTPLPRLGSALSSGTQCLIYFPSSGASIAKLQVFPDTNGLTSLLENDSNWTHRWPCRTSLIAELPWH